MIFRHIEAVLQKIDPKVARAVGRDFGDVDVECEACAHVGVEGVGSRGVLAAINPMEVDKAVDNSLFTPENSRFDE